MGTRQSLDRIWQCAAVRAGGVLVLMLAWTTVCVGLEASENPSEINASGNRSGEYRLAPGDRIAVLVFDQTQLSGEFVVNGAGQVLLPLAGTVNVAGLTVVEAQKLIQERFADGLLVQPTVSLRVAEYRPVFIFGNVRKPGSYPFQFGQLVRAVIASAGGQGRSSEQLNVGMYEFMRAEERVRQLETNRLDLLVRKARLKAQRDEVAEFVIPQLVGLDPDNNDVSLVYAAESDTFLRLVEAYHSQLEVLQQQRPRIEAEIRAVTEQIAKEQQRLDIVNERVAELEEYAKRGLVRKYVLSNQRIEKALVEAEVSRLEAGVARLRQNMGDLDFRIKEVKANYKRQVLGELQETLQRLREIEATLGTARDLRDYGAEDAGIAEGAETNDAILISRTSQYRTVTFKATYDTLIEPGDVIEVKRKIPKPATRPGVSTAASPKAGTNADRGTELDRTALDRDLGPASTQVRPSYRE